MLRKQWSRAGIIVISFVALIIPVTIPLSVFAGEILATSTDAPSWLSAQVPRVTKTGDLPANQVPYSKSLDCNEKSLIDPVYHTPVTGCSISTGAGTIINGQYSDGTHRYASVFTSLLRSYGESQLVYASGGETLIYPALTKSQLVFNNSSNLPGYNYTPTAPYRILKSATGKTIYLDTFNMAYSNNGRWLVTAVLREQVHGLMVFDTQTYTGKFIAPLTTSTLLFGNNSTPGSGNFAISDDGRHVAVSFTQVAQNATERGLRVYDTTTCTDQYGIALNSAVYCNYKNVWTGKLNGITKISAGIQEQLAETVERPLNVRFKDANTITFSGIYDYVMATNTMKAATYEATMAPTPPPPIKLLALGDSYISGEGAFSYISGTDTSNNKCHQSASSYLYLLGAQYAAEYHSVACSGAVIGDVMPSDVDKYKGQAKDNTYWYDRDQLTILNSYSPGYAAQSLFVTATKPNAVLLSVGGNDINFGDIVKRCVASFAWDPCYHKQSERRSLLLTIYSKFSALKSTYSKILSEAPEGARLYVVGYPQVINPTGNCGVNVHFDDSEKQFAALLVDRLNDTIESAAESSGAVYVDISDALVGHRLCDTHDDGVNGLTNGDDGFSMGAWLGTKSYSFGLGNESYHPTVLGHQLISGAIAQQTDNLTKKSQGAASVLLPKIKDDDEFITTGVADSAQPRRIERQELVDSNIVSAGDKVTLDFDANVSNIKQNSVYQVVFHSEEVVVANGTMPESGQLHLDIVVPKLTPGIHSVHIFATDVNGEGVDVTKDLYVAASRDDIDGDGIKNADDPLPFINETDSVITPALPVEPTQKDDPRGDEDYKDQDAPSNQSAPNTAETEEDNISKQGQAATTFRLAESAQEKVLAFEQNVTPMTHSQEAVSIGAKEVLGAVALQRSKLQSNGSAKHGSLQTKPMILIGFALAVCTTGVVLAVIINKRSKKQSDRI